MTDIIAFEDPQEPVYEIPLFDRNEPRSLINIVWPELHSAMVRLEESNIHLFEMSEYMLKKLAKPEPLHLMLRLRFWQDYSRAQSTATKMKVNYVTGGLCPREYWSRSVSRNPEMLAWIITPPPKYLTRMEALLYMGLDEMEKILSLPIENEETGVVNTRLISEKVKIFQMLDLRVKGAVIQKLAIHQKVDQTVTRNDDPLKNLSLTDLKSLDASISQVRRQIEQAQSRDIQVIDVVGIDEESAPSEA